MPDERIDPNSPEQQAIVNDLNEYDNTEVFYDPTLPQTYKLSIFNGLKPERPIVFRVEVDGILMTEALIETLFYMIGRDPRNVKQLCRRYGVKDFAELRAVIERDPQFDPLADAMWLFFVRYFPKLLLSIYEITLISSIVSAHLSAMRQEAGKTSEAGEVEVLARSKLESLITGLEKDIKRMVDIRSKGRPLGSVKPPERRAQEAAAFEKEVEEVIRTLLSPKNEMPTKTAVAKALGIGGLNPKTGIDSSLAAFRNKLDRLNVDYKAIVERVKLDK